MPPLIKGGKSAAARPNKEWTKIDPED